MVKTKQHQPKKQT